jgi:hypothetical protein
MTRDTAPAFSDVKGTNNHSYNEPAFRYFLEVERRRAHRAGRTIALVLVKSRSSASHPVEGLAPDATNAVFAALGDSVRDADFIGWYREGRIAAAVMPLSDTPPKQVGKHFSDRVGRRLKERLWGQSDRVRVRVFELGARSSV